MKTKEQIKFIPDNRNDFFKVLRNRVDEYFTTNKIEKTANTKMVIKTILLLSIYLAPFILLCLLPYQQFTIDLLLWALMGIGVAGVGMSVMHDANHGSYSSNSTVNYLLGHTLNLLGGSVYNWKLQHNVLHHTYTNIHGMDDDIEDKAIMRFSPYGEKKWYHRFQFVYVFFFYAIITLYWGLAKDFIQFAKYTRNGVNPQKGSKNLWILVKIIVLKTFYFAIIIGLPIYLGQREPLIVIGGFVFMNLFGGLILSVVFQLAHTVENTTHPLPNNVGVLSNDWAIHQLNTTSNFSRNNKLLTWYLGGLNYQVEHHLFPKICHIHYPEISNIVKQTAEEYNINYLEYPSFGSALQSHIRALKKFGK